MTTNNTEVTRIQHILKNYQHIAVVGLSADQHKPSYEVAHYLQVSGYDIIPINPRYAGQSILNKRVYATLSDAKEAGEQIEIVDIFRRAENTPPIVEEASKIGAKVAWLQLGISNTESQQIAHNTGLEYIENLCIKIEHFLLS